MARIRTIKPEFWSSPGIETLEYRWRLLYIAMWQLADDWGRGAFIPRELLGFAFPMDEEMTSAEISAGCREISGVFGTVFYTVGKRHYFSIPSWEKHQRIDKRAKASKFPAPEDGEPYIFDDDAGQAGFVEKQAVRPMRPVDDVRKIPGDSRKPRKVPEKSP